MYFLESNHSSKKDGTHRRRAIVPKLQFRVTCRLYSSPPPRSTLITFSSLSCFFSTLSNCYVYPIISFLSCLPSPSFALFSLQPRLPMHTTERKAWRPSLPISLPAAFDFGAGRDVQLRYQTSWVFLATRIDSCCWPMLPFQFRKSPMRGRTLFLLSPTPTTTYRRGCCAFQR